MPSPTPRPARAAPPPGRAGTQPRVWTNATPSRCRRAVTSPDRPRSASATLRWPSTPAFRVTEIAFRQDRKESTARDVRCSGRVPSIESRCNFREEPLQRRPQEAWVPQSRAGAQAILFPHYFPSPRVSNLLVAPCRIGRANGDVGPRHQASWSAEANIVGEIVVGFDGSPIRGKCPQKRVYAGRMMAPRRHQASHPY
jgi:hypothetical protein